jgi:ribosome-associated protein
MPASASDLKITERLFIPLHELEFSFARSSGAGGQNVNKVNSKALLRWNFLFNRSLPEDVKERFREQFSSRLTTAGELLLTSERYRDQIRNQEDCLEKLRAMILSVATPPKKRKATRPTRASKVRRLKAKGHLKERKTGRGKVRSWDD